MRFTNVLIRSHGELSKMVVPVRHALVQEARSSEKGTYPLVYKYLGKRDNYRTVNDIPEDSIIGSITNIRQDENTGNIVCDVTIHDVKQNSDNFNFKIDNIVVCVKDGKETIANGVIYNSYAKSVIDGKRHQSMSKYVDKKEASPIPDIVAGDKDLNPLFMPEVQESIDSALKDELGGGDGYDD